jgi:hypothetical protein
MDTLYAASAKIYDTGATTYATTSTAGFNFKQPVYHTKNGAADAIIYSINEGSGNAVMEVRTDGAGDPYYQAQLGGVHDSIWSWGLDNSDSNKFVLSDNWGLGTNNALEVAPTTRIVNFPQGVVVSGQANFADDIVPDSSIPNSITITQASDADSTGTEVSAALDARADTAMLKDTADALRGEVPDSITTLNLWPRFSRTYFDTTLAGDDSLKALAADSAGKALADASGNTITTTYAPVASPTFTGVVTIPDFILYTGGDNGGAYDSTDAPSDGDVLTWNTGGSLDWQPGGAAAGDSTWESIRADSAHIDTLTSDSIQTADINITTLATIADLLLVTGGNDAAYDPTDVPADGDQLTWNTDGTTDWQPAGGGAGEANTISAIGESATGADSLTAGKSGVDLRVKSIIADAGLSTTVTDTTVELDVAVSSSEITDQQIAKADIDTTGSNFVFDDAYEGTSAEADSQYSTHNYVKVLAEDSLDEVWTALGKIEDDTASWIDHVADNTQAHSDYLLNSESDAFTGNLSGDGIVADSAASDTLWASRANFDSVTVAGNYVTTGLVDTVDVANLAKEVEDLTDDSASWNDHVADNSQAHSDYLLNSGSDAFAGNLSGDGIIADSAAIDTLHAISSFQLPSAADPTTDAEGEAAWDNNDDAIEVYMGDESESALIPAYQKIDALIFAPDQVADEIAIMRVDALLYPFGIEIDQVSITTSVDGAYSMVFEEWAADPPAAQNDISTVTTGASDSYAEEAPDTDAALDADDYIFLHVPATDIDWIHVQVIFHVNDGN